MKLLEQFNEYKNKGWVPIACNKFKEGAAGWNDGHDYKVFNNDYNCIGIVLGKSGLIDIDLENSYARFFGWKILPKTFAFGRESCPKSHYIFIDNNNYKHEDFSLSIPGEVMQQRFPRLYQNSHKDLMLELRAAGNYTVFPGSKIKNKLTNIEEEVRIDIPIEPIEAPKKLKFMLHKINLACGLAYTYPTSNRDLFICNVWCCLMHRGWNSEEISDFVYMLCEAVGDEEVRKRANKKLDKFISKGWDTPDLAAKMDLPESVVEAWFENVDLQTEENNRAYTTHDLTDFLEIEDEDVEYILDPIFFHGGLYKFYAKRGVGKTYFGLYLGLTIATGTTAFGKWTSKEPHPILYVDAEMPLKLTKKRLRDYQKNPTYQNLKQGYFKLLHYSQQTNKIIKGIETPNGQTRMIKTLDEMKNATGKKPLVILDNLRSLSDFEENDSSKQGFKPINNFFLHLRAQGYTVVFVHHAGKSGDSRGTSSMDDFLDLILKLEHPSKYTAADGLKVNVIFDKVRDLMPEQSIDFCTKYLGQGEWKLVDTSSDMKIKIRSYWLQGMKQSEAIKQYKEDTGESIGKTTVSGYYKEFNEKGRTPEEEKEGAERYEEAAFGKSIC